MSDENTQPNETSTNGANGTTNGSHHGDQKPAGSPGGGRKKKKHKRHGKPTPETPAKAADAAIPTADAAPDAPEAVSETAPMEQFQSEDRLHASEPRAPITFLDMPPEIPSADPTVQVDAASLETQEPPVPTVPEPSPEPSPEATAATATPVPPPQKVVDGLRLRMKVWTDSKTGKRYLMPAAFMRDIVKGQPVSDAMYAYAMSDDSTKLVTLTAREWNSLPFFYFQEDGPAPRATARPVDVIR